MQRLWTVNILPVLDGSLNRLSLEKWTTFTRQDLMHSKKKIWNLILFYIIFGCLFTSQFKFDHLQTLVLTVQKQLALAEEDKTNINIDATHVSMSIDSKDVVQS